MECKAKLLKAVLFYVQVYVEVVVGDDDVTPVFPSDVIRLEFREDIPVSTILYIARASVSTNTSSVISYGLSAEAADEDCFSVDRWTGEVRLRRELDRESSSFHRFTVKAWTDDRRAGSLDVLLTVLDTNDQPPAFSQPAYTCHLTAATSPHTPLCSVSASDPDQGQNGRVVYFLSADDDDALEAFYVDPHSGVIYANRSLPGNRTLTIVAMDAGVPPMKSSAPVLVTSDVSPSVNCAVESLEMKIEENLPAYSIVGRVRFIYDDVTTAPVTGYQLNQDGGQEAFEIDGKTGEIVTKVILDRELCSNYSLNISATHQLPGSHLYVYIHRKWKR